MLEPPALCVSDVTACIREQVQMEEYLFYRTGADEFDLLLGGRERPVWECFCTGCGQTFQMDKARKKPPKGWKTCPQCGTQVTARRWRDRGPLRQQRFAFHLWQKGQGKQLWMRSFRVRRTEDGEMEVFEYARVRYDTGGAARWTRTWSRLYGPARFTERKSVRTTNWVEGMTVLPGFYSAISMDTIRGSCAEYSGLDQAIARLRDPAEYLALYCRYPACEYLWKLGLGWLLEAREGDRQGFWKAVDLRAGTPKGLLRGLDKADIRLLRTCSTSLQALCIYQQLRAKGAVQAEEDALLYAAGVAAAGMQELCLQEPKRLYRYFARQKRRSRYSYPNLLRDWQDYLCELDGIGGGERLPEDLPAAHARLSARLRALQCAQRNAAFRVRRRLLAGCRYAWGGMLIRPIDSETELLREGELQNNCVAGYAARHAAGKTNILVLRRKDASGEPWCTIEWKDGKVLQCRARNNSAAPPEAQAFLERWIEHMKGADKHGQRNAKH